MCNVAIVLKEELESWVFEARKPRSWEEFNAFKRTCSFIIVDNHCEASGLKVVDFGIGETPMKAIFAGNFSFFVKFIPEDGEEEHFFEDLKVSKTMEESTLDAVIAASSNYERGIETETFNSFMCSMFK